jgi:hypothetical protein
MLVCLHVSDLIIVFATFRFFVMVSAATEVESGILATKSRGNDMMATATALRYKFLPVTAGIKEGVGLT